MLDFTMDLFLITISLASFIALNQFEEFSACDDQFFDKTHHPYEHIIHL